MGIKRIEIEWSVEKQVKLDGFASWTVNGEKWNAADAATQREIALEAISSSLTNSLLELLQGDIQLTIRD